MIVVAGVIANVDYFATMATPVVYLEWHRTYGHSILVSLIVDTLLAAMYLFWVCKAQSAEEPQSTGVSSVRIFGAVMFAGLLHLAFDACQSAGTMILWPFSSRRIAADWLPRVDPWIIAILLVAILLPELSRLVTDEIGAKSKKPRGRIGAIVGLVAVFLYVGVRADLHANAIAAMQSRTYFRRFASPRRGVSGIRVADHLAWHRRNRSLSAPANDQCSTGREPRSRQWRNALQARTLPDTQSRSTVCGGETIPRHRTIPESVRRANSRGLPDPDPGPAIRGDGRLAA